jgi:hypothetical protein
LDPKLKGSWYVSPYDSPALLKKKMLQHHNDIVVEIVHSILDLTKRLYTVGVEFGQEPDAIHEMLYVITAYIPFNTLYDSSNSCNIGHLIPKIKTYTPTR